MRKRFLFLFVLLLSLQFHKQTAQERQKETIQLTFRQRRMVGRIEKGRQSLWVQNPIYLRRCQKPQGNLLHQDYLSRRSYQSNLAMNRSRIHKTGILSASFPLITKKTSKRVRSRDGSQMRNSQPLPGVAVSTPRQHNGSHHKHRRLLQTSVASRSNLYQPYLCRYAAING